MTMIHFMMSFSTVLRRSSSNDKLLLAYVRVLYRNGVTTVSVTQGGN